MTAQQQYRTRRETQDDVQNLMNAAFASGASADDMLTAIREYAEQTHSEFPQYAGHWNDYVLVRITRRVETKAGEAFEAGDVAVARYDHTIACGWSYCTVYSVRNGVDTSVFTGNVVRV